MIRLKTSENVRLGIAAAVVLISLNFWSFRLLEGSIFRILELLASLCLVVIVFYNTNVFLQKGLKFKALVLFLLFLPLTGVVGAYIFHDQPVGLSLILERVNLFWLLYFVLHILNVSSEKIRKLMVFIGCVWAFLTIIQQFTYPVIFFYSRSEDIRAGVVRLMPAGQHFGVFMLLYSFHNYLTTKKRNALLFVGLGLAGLYFYGTRQVAIMAILCMLVAVLMLKGIAKWKFIFLSTLIGITVVLVAQPTIISDYIHLTTVQMSDDDYIRYKAADFYLNDYWPHWGAKLLGNGKPHETSAYGIEMEYIVHELGFYRADIGIIGTYNSFGIFYVLTIIIASIKGVFLKFNSDKDKYLKLLFFYVTFLLPLNVGYAHAPGMCFFSLLYFLVDKSFEKGKKEEISFEQKVFEKQLADASI